MRSGAGLQLAKDLSMAVVTVCFTEPYLVKSRLLKKSMVGMYSFFSSPIYRRQHTDARAINHVVSVFQSLKPPQSQTPCAFYAVPGYPNQTSPPVLPHQSKDQHKYQHLCTPPQPSFPQLNAVPTHAIVNPTSSMLTTHLTNSSVCSAGLPSMSNSRTKFCNCISISLSFCVYNSWYEGGGGSADEGEDGEERICTIKGSSR